MRFVGSLIRALIVCVLAKSSVAMAQTDEIQVYDASITSPGSFSVTVHNNYTPIGRKEPDFPGGIVPNHSLNGVVETTYGVNDWLELGLYLPLYSLTSDGRVKFNGAKLRALFVVPHAEERTFFYGVNFEFSINERHWETTRNSAEIRPIIGARFGPVDVIFNPIIDTSLNGIHALDFAPAERIAYNLSQSWAVALEHYADYGPFSRFEPVDQQEHTLFAVVDYAAGPTSIDFGVGHGFTAASDSLVLKLIVTRDF